MVESNCNLLDAWNLYIDTRPLTKEDNIKKETNRFYKHIYPYLGNIKMSSIHAKDIMKFQKSLFQKKLSPQSVKNCLSLLRVLYNRAKKYEIYTGDIPYFEMPLTNNARLRFLTKKKHKYFLKLFIKKVNYGMILLYLLCLQACELEKYFRLFHPQ